MKKMMQNVALATAGLVAAAGIGVAATANAATAAPAHGTQPATASLGSTATVEANERVVEAFLQDVFNKHHGDEAARFFTPNVQWYGGTVGTVTGASNLAGVFAGIVAAFPDAHATVQDIFGEGDQVVVYDVVSGTQEGAVLGIPASGRHVQWGGVDIFQLNGGKISHITDGDDWTALLHDTGTYTAPWIS